ncbi:hypothetical protein JYU34_006766 [Plutella xylostella]|uniref:FHA domain-containing protein n=1 Tax=Plutella xylostella TaxID=51655 RepID=A0ABQ7QSR7_PLUXY|nr:hypothetical protein JYU34_006766 [Plutella xylostella]
MDVTVESGSEILRPRPCSMIVSPGVPPPRSIEPRHLLIANGNVSDEHALVSVWG